MIQKETVGVVTYYHSDYVKYTQDNYQLGVDFVWLHNEEATRGRSFTSVMVVESGKDLAHVAEIARRQIVEAEIKIGVGSNLSPLNSITNAIMTAAESIDVTSIIVISEKLWNHLIYELTGVTDLANAKVIRKLDFLGHRVILATNIKDTEIIVK